MGVFIMIIVIIGAGGQARVVYEILRYNRNMEIFAFIDNIIKGSEEKIMEIQVLGDHSILPKLIKEGVKGYIVAVGDNKIRMQHFNKCLSMELIPINAIHPTAHIAYNGVKIGKGVVIATGATIATGTTIGDNVIINTGAIIEHEDVIEDHVHIAPGVVLAGRITVKENAFIGAGSVVKEYITIGKNTIIGAGSIVLEDIPDNVVAVGAPVKVIKIRKEEEK